MTEPVDALAWTHQHGSWHGTAFMNGKNGTNDIELRLEPSKRPCKSSLFRNLCPDQTCFALGND